MSPELDYEALQQQVDGELEETNIEWENRAKRQRLNE
jgi:hypothetical protein